MKKIGLIAGNRKFPLILAEALKKRDFYIVAVAIRGDTSPLLGRVVDKIHWLSLAQFSKMFDIFKKEGITEAVMAGQITPRRLFTKEIEKDRLLNQIITGLKDKKADTIFGKIADELNESGITLLNSTIFLENYLPKKGSLTKEEPDFQTWEDIYFGLELARAIAGLDIGQTVAVKSKAVVAVEALEGTDNLIKRSGRVSGGGFTLIKVSKPMQDKRFDIPVVGLNTIKNLISSRAKCLAIEADNTLFIDKEKAVKLAEKNGIIVVAI